MKMKYWVCLLLACLLLTGCSLGKKSATGDMDAAVTALKWQDYQTAYDEATAFLKQVPHSDRAKVVQETAAWSLLGLDADKLEQQTLSNGKLTVTYNGFTVDSITDNTIGGEFELKSFAVELGGDSDYFQQDFAFSSVYLESVTIKWKYTNHYKTYSLTIGLPNNIHKDAFTYSMDKCYITGDKLSGETKEELVKYLQTAWLPLMDEILTIIQDQYGMEPAHLGFDSWNQPADYTG